MGLFVSLLAAFVISNQALANESSHPPAPEGCGLSASPALHNTPDDEKGGLVTTYEEAPLTVANIYEGYRIGLLAEGGKWWAWPKHGVIIFDEMHISENDIRDIRLAESKGYTVTHNKAFREVITHCMNMPRPAGVDPETGKMTFAATFITPEHIEAMVNMYEAGYGHSWEVWKDGILVAGFYGIMVDGVFTGESMFHLKDEEGKTLKIANNAGKFAANAMFNWLKEQGITFMDSQAAMGLMAKWGARMIPREEYVDMLKEARSRK